jgi:hypothetical protein
VFLKHLIVSVTIGSGRASFARSLGLAFLLLACPFAFGSRARPNMPYAKGYWMKISNNGSRRNETR